MDFVDEEFQFILELIILSRNKDGATLKEIHDDFYDLFDVHFEAIWGYNYWEEYVRQLLTNVMCNVSTKTTKQGCLLYYMNLQVAIAKLSDDCSENIIFVRDQLEIKLENVQADYDEMIRSQSRLMNSRQKTSIEIDHEDDEEDEVIKLSESFSLQSSGRKRRRISESSEINQDLDKATLEYLDAVISKKSKIQVDADPKKKNNRSELFANSIIPDLENFDDEIFSTAKFEIQKTLHQLALLQIKRTNNNARSYSSSQTESSNSGKSKSVRSDERITNDPEFYGHSLIGDDLFLEVCNIDLKYRKTIKNRIQRIGQCISGQSIKSAIKNISQNIHKLRDRVIINLGTLDLLQGRELIDMMREMSTLVEILLNHNIFPIITTLPPLANHMHDKYSEKKRKSFNQFLLDQNFAVIDIDECFLSSFGRILFDLYQPESKLVSGSRCPYVLWNHIGRQRVVKMLKRKIPEIYDEFY